MSSVISSDRDAAVADSKVVTQRQRQINCLLHCQRAMSYTGVTAELTATKSRSSLEWSLNLSEICSWFMWPTNTLRATSTILITSRVKCFIVLKTVLGVDFKTL